VTNTSISRAWISFWSTIRWLYCSIIIFICICNDFDVHWIWIFSSRLTCLTYLTDLNFSDV
jgi:hypothetical protein